MKERMYATLKLGILVAAILALTGVAYAAKDGKKVATVDIPKAAELYAATPQPLTVAQCGQCHPSYFNELKNEGGKHQFDCQKCHNKFHAYNPKKNNYDALMPKCASCHAQPHGAKVTDCASCHSNPHALKKMALTPRLISACADCHSGPKDQLVKFPSKHSKVACQFCHKSHGFIPTCATCHKPHFAGQEASTCTKCHPVHMPKQVTYEKDTPAATCGACHGKVFAKWQKTPSKHGKVNCATCHHTKHKYVPKCTECHPTPHKKEILDRYPNCLGCHLDVHDLPIGGGKK